MKKIIGLSLGMLLLTGCFGSKETVTLCRAKSDGVDNEVVLEANGDQLLKLTFNEVIHYGDKGITDEDVQKIIDYTYPSEKVDGVTFNVDLKDGVATTKIVIDYEESDFTELVSVGWLDGDADSIRYVSLKETVDEYESIMRLTCEEQ